MNINARRSFLKTAIAGSALTLTATMGLLKPRAVFGAWKESAFRANNTDDIIAALFPNKPPITSELVEVKVPSLVEDGSVVPVSVEAQYDNIESIAVICAHNPYPLAASFDLGESVDSTLQTRVKLSDSSDIIGVVEAGDRLYVNKRFVKVTTGGCGG